MKHTFAFFSLLLLYSCSLIAMEKSPAQKQLFNVQAPKTDDAKTAFTTLRKRFNDQLAEQQQGFNATLAERESTITDLSKTIDSQKEFILSEQNQTKLLETKLTNTKNARDVAENKLQVILHTTLMAEMQREVKQREKRQRAIALLKTEAPQIAAAIAMLSQTTAQTRIRPVTPVVIEETPTAPAQQETTGWLSYLTLGLIGGSSQPTAPVTQPALVNPAPTKQTAQPAQVVPADTAQPVVTDLTDSTSTVVTATDEQKPETQS